MYTWSSLEVAPSPRGYPFMISAYVESFLKPPDNLIRFLKDLQKLLWLTIFSYYFNLPDVSDSILHFMVYKFSKGINTCIFLGQLCLIYITYLIHNRLFSGWPLTWKSGESQGK